MRYKKRESKFSSALWLLISVLLEAADTVLIERVIGKRIDTITGGTYILKTPDLTLHRL